MIKIRLTIIALLTVISFGYSQKSNVSFTTENTSDLYFLQAKDFYLTHYLYLDLFLRENLYTDAPYQEVFTIIDHVKKYVAPDHPLTVKIKTPNNKKYTILFSIKEIEGKPILVAMTNHNLQTKKFTKKFGKDSYTRWYFLADDKIVFRKDMSTHEENQNLQGNDLANLYLFDEKTENDSLVHSVLEKARGTNITTDDMLLTKLIEVKAALSLNDYIATNNLLQEAENLCQTGGKELNGYRSVIEVTRFQMQLMKMMAKSDPRQRPPMIVFKESEVIPFELVERAPIPSDCSPTLDNSALKECTRDSIRWHVNRKFDIGITATEGRAKGIYKINTKFIIDSTGEIVNIEIESDSQLLSDEAYRVISSISTMRPGMHEGNPIHVTYTLPITLSVQ